MTTTTATPTVPTTVYLNEVPASFLGFNRAAPARLRAAATFNLPIPTDTDHSRPPSAPHSSTSSTSSTANPPPPGPPDGAAPDTAACPSATS
ncbi:hypothetical protein [Mycolicibacterium gilvum]|uniref:hypothetical protein n=1 Tax=Mycolicibacterium gilvum TaxID=1804 RepID=UPI001F44FDC8|nr:hypothetical protein [Mycolicibacterium gilvum]